MTDIAVRVWAWLAVSRRAESGQSLGSFSMILLFAVVAGAIAIALLAGGIFETTPTSEAPDFEPPNPFD